MSAIGSLFSSFVISLLHRPNTSGSKFSFPSLLGAIALSASLMPSLAQAQKDDVIISPLPVPICGAEVKEEVAKILEGYELASDDEKKALADEVYLKYQYCADDAKLVGPNDYFYIAAKQCGSSVAYLGSIYYEEMSCCGYDPQRRQFACPVKIKQTFGFGGAPLPGSREHTLHCVADNSGTLVPVGHDSVHLANSNSRPTWQFAVIAAANDNLHTVQPMNGQTRRARSILSWALPPTNCNYKPIWGNVLDYRIRLDQ